MTLNEQLADLGTRMLDQASAPLPDRGDDGGRDLLIEGAATLRTLAATLAEVPDPRAAPADPRLATYQAMIDRAVDQVSVMTRQVLESLGVDLDDWPDDHWTWTEVLERVERTVEDRRNGWSAATRLGEVLDQVRTAAGAPAGIDHPDLVARIADRAQLVTTLARSLEIRPGHPDLPAAVTVAVANLVKDKRHTAERYSYDVARGHVARVLKALGTWSPGHEDYDTEELATDAIKVAAGLIGDLNTARAQVTDLIAERRRIAVVLGLEPGALVSTMHQVVAQLQSSAEDSPDGLADRIAEALGLGQARTGTEWTDESLAWLVDQVEDMRDQLHRAVVGAGDARTKAAELAERLERMTTDRDAERAERQDYLRDLADALGFSVSANLPAWTRMLELARQYRAEHLENDVQIAPARTEDGE